MLVVVVVDSGVVDTVVSWLWWLLPWVSEEGGPFASVVRGGCGGGAAAVAAAAVGCGSATGRVVGVSTNGGCCVCGDCDCTAATPDPMVQSSEPCAAAGGVVVADDDDIRGSEEGGGGRNTLVVVVVEAPFALVVIVVV